MKYAASEANRHFVDVPMQAKQQKTGADEQSPLEKKPIMRCKRASEAIGDGQQSKV